MDYYKIGQKIRKYRKAHGFSQEQLAEQIGISVTHMSHIETGNTKLREDKRIKSIEKINVKNCSFFDVYGAESLEENELPSFMSMDLSFISIKKVLENVLNFLADEAELVLLIKPQFEAGRSEIEEGGVVRDEKVRQKIVEDIKEYSSSLGLEVVGVIDSPIIGAKSGNSEYLIYLKKHI